MYSARSAQFPADEIPAMLPKREVIVGDPSPLALAEQTITIDAQGDDVDLVLPVVAPPLADALREERQARVAAPCDERAADVLENRPSELAFSLRGAVDPSMFPLLDSVVRFFIGLRTGDIGMAKNSGKGDGRSKIRVVVIDADLGEGELRDVTQAIANALRPAPVLVQRQVTAGPAVTPALAETEEIEDAVLIENTETSPAPRAKASSKPRKYPSPKVLDEVDLESDLSFPDFAAGKRPKNTQDRYLVAAAWYKLHRNTPSVTTHHIYTCFLHPKVKWPTGQADFDQPLRQLVTINRMGRGERSHYVINHIGLADVKALGNGSE